MSSFESYTHLTLYVIDELLKIPLPYKAIQDAIEHLQKSIENHQAGLIPCIEEINSLLGKLPEFYRRELLQLYQDTLSAEVRAQAVEERQRHFLPRLIETELDFINELMEQELERRREEKENEEK